MRHYGLHIKKAADDIRISMEKAERIGATLVREKGVTKELIQQAMAQTAAGRIPDAEQKDPELSAMFDQLALTLSAVDVGKALQEAVLSSHAFTFEGGVADLLVETSAPDPERLPFGQCYLDVEFNAPDTDWKVLGIMVSETSPPDSTQPSGLFATGQPPDDFFISAWLVPANLPPGHYASYLHFVCNYRREVHDGQSDLAKHTMGKRIIEVMGIRQVHRVEKALRGFVAAWAAMVNDPEVIVVESMKGPNARIRFERDHKVKPPASCRAIRLTGELRRYVQVQRSAWEAGEKTGKRAHWVRGHVRRLTSERYTNKRGLTLWIPPHVRGTGAIVRNAYEVKPKTEQEATA